MDVATKQLLSDKLDWIKFSGLSWKGDGFYYSRYDAPDEQSKLSKKNEFHKVYYHKVGTTQAQDQLVYVDKEHPSATPAQASRKTSASSSSAPPKAPAATKYGTATCRMPPRRISNYS